MISGVDVEQLGDLGELRSTAFSFRPSAGEFVFADRGKPERLAGVLLMDSTHLPINNFSVEPLHDEAVGNITRQLGRHTDVHRQRHVALRRGHRPASRPVILVFVHRSASTDCLPIRCSG